MVHARFDHSRHIVRRDQWNITGDDDNRSHASANGPGEGSVYRG